MGKLTKMEDKKVRKLSVDEMLNSFHNKFLERYVSLVIDSEIYGRMDPNETAYEKNLAQGQLPPGTQVPKSLKIRVTAKEALEDLGEQLKGGRRILDSIEAVRESKEFKGL